jgi:hypothetical protein
MISHDANYDIIPHLFSATDRRLINSHEQKNGFWKRNRQSWASREARWEGNQKNSVISIICLVNEIDHEV